MLQLVSIANLSLSELDQVFCSVDRLQEYFIFPQGFDVDKLVSSLCGLNTTALVEEFMHHFSINQLISEVMHWFGKIVIFNALCCTCI